MRPLSAARLVLLAVLAARLPAVAAEPEIEVELGARQIYEGQSVLYRVRLNHVESPSPPELRGFGDFDVVSLGERSLDSTSVTIINGQVTKVVQRGRQYDYRLTPRKVGLLTIPGPVAKVDGRELAGPERSLQVRPADEQDAVFLEIAADRPAVYPMQPFTVTLTVDVKALPEPLENQSPLGVQQSPAALSIPWAIDEELADGLEPDIGWQSWLAPMQTGSSEGFSINNIGRSSVFSLFGNRPMQFQPPAGRVTRRDAGGKEADCWRYVFPRTFKAAKIGSYSFGPATLEGTFGVRLEGRQLAGETVYAMARPIEVIVKDAPAEGRPAGFTGAIGRFTLRGQLEPREVKVGDPMTLTLTLSGEGTLGGTFAPDLGQIPQIASNFKIYEATEETSTGSSRFTYALRPLVEGIGEFPAVPLAYFDVESEQFVTLRTDPIPITVAAADRLSGDQIVGPPRRGGTAQGEVQAQGGGIFANLTDPSTVRNEQVRPLRWLAWLAGLAGLYLALAVVTERVRRLTGDQALWRRRAAPSAARARLRRARAAVEAGRTPEGTDLLKDALVHLVADAADAPAAGLTLKDVCVHLRALGAEATLAERVGEFLEACDAGRFGAFSHDAGQLVHSAETLVGQVIQSLNAQKRFR